MKTRVTAAQITEAGHDVEYALHIMALCSFLDCEPGDLTLEAYDHYGLARYSYGRQEYAIGTDQQAQAAARDYIRDSVWAFNASFICSHCGIPELEEAIQTFQEQKCEDANDALLALVEKWGLEEFCEEAISSDGRGHFLSQYDGEENEETVTTAEAEQSEWFYQASNGSESVTLYIYRLN